MKRGILFSTNCGVVVWCVRYIFSAFSSLSAAWEAAAAAAGSLLIVFREGAAFVEMVVLDRR